MMIRPKAFATMLALSGTFSTGAEAAIVTFDFAAIADGDASYGVPAGEYGASNMTFTKNGLSVTATAYRAGDPDTTYHPYLDEHHAGLGVCKTLNSSDHCSPASDDNVTDDESLVLRFDRAVTIESIRFRNGGHGKRFKSDADFWLRIDGGTDSTYALTHLFDTPLTGTEFVFSNLNGSNKNKYVFYIESMEVQAVPVPAAVWLFGSGLLGLAGVARRRR